MDNLMLFYPLIVLLFFIFFDVRNRKKRPAPPPQQPADRQTQLPEEWQSRGYEDEDEEVSGRQGTQKAACGGKDLSGTCTGSSCCGGGTLV